jgi:hypothetical protein
MEATLRLPAVMLFQKCPSHCLVREALPGDTELRHDDRRVNSRDYGRACSHGLGYARHPAISLKIPCVDPFNVCHIHCYSSLMSV